MLNQLNYINNLDDDYYFEILYFVRNKIIRSEFIYNKSNNTLNTNDVNNDTMKSLLERNKGHILNFIKTKI